MLWPHGFSQGTFPDYGGGNGDDCGDIGAVYRAQRMTQCRHCAVTM